MLISHAMYVEVAVQYVSSTCVDLMVWSSLVVTAILWENITAYWGLNLVVIAFSCVLESGAQEDEPLDIT